MRTARSRHIVSGGMIGLTYLAAILATLPLVLILAHLIMKGASSLSLSFFTHMPGPVGEPGGGMANAIVGTLVLIGIASAIGLPIGIGAGLYLAEKKSTPLASTVRPDPASPRSTAKTIERWRRSRAPNNGPARRCR